MSCFQPCGCVCGVSASGYDEIVAKEAPAVPNLEVLVSSHVGWYHDLMLEDLLFEMIRDLGLKRQAGVYVLWRADGFCSVHGKEHLRAWYVGKSGFDVDSRLVQHQLKKAVGGDLPTEVTFAPMNNRLAKYTEQLLLDMFDFPLNRTENPGRLALCMHADPAAWN